MKYVQYAAKAIGAASGAFVTALTTAYSDGAVSSVEWILVIVGSLGTGALAFELTNKPDLSDV